MQNKSPKIINSNISKLDQETEHLIKLIDRTSEIYKELLSKNINTSSAYKLPEKLKNLTKSLSKENRLNNITNDYKKMKHSSFKEINSNEEDKLNMLNLMSICRMNLTNKISSKRHSTIKSSLSPINNRKFLYKKTSDFTEDFNLNLNINGNNDTNLIISSNNNCKNKIVKNCKKNFIKNENSIFTRNNNNYNNCEFENNINEKNNSFRDNNLFSINTNEYQKKDFISFLKFANNDQVFINDIDSDDNINNKKVFKKLNSNIFFHKETKYKNDINKESEIKEDFEENNFDSNDKNFNENNMDHRISYKNFDTNLIIKGNENNRWSNFNYKINELNIKINPEIEAEDDLSQIDQSSTGRPMNLEYENYNDFSLQKQTEKINIKNKEISELELKEDIDNNISFLKKSNLTNITNIDKSSLFLIKDYNKEEKYMSENKQEEILVNKKSNKLMNSDAIIKMKTKKEFDKNNILKRQSIKTIKINKKIIVSSIKKKSNFNTFYNNYPRSHRSCKNSYFHNSFRVKDYFNSSNKNRVNRKSFKINKSKMYFIKKINNKKFKCLNKKSFFRCKSPFVEESKKYSFSYLDTVKIYNNPLLRSISKTSNKPYIKRFNSYVHKNNSKDYFSSDFTKGSNETQKDFNDYMDELSYLNISNNNEIFCRICKEDNDDIDNNLISICACKGFMKYMHLNCSSKYIRDMKIFRYTPFKCEICKQNYLYIIEKKYEWVLFKDFLKFIRFIIKFITLVLIAFFIQCPSPFLGFFIVDEFINSIVFWIVFFLIISLVYYYKSLLSYTILETWTFFNISKIKDRCLNKENNKKENRFMLMDNLYKKHKNQHFSLDSYLYNEEKDKTKFIKDMEYDIISPEKKNKKSTLNKNNFYKTQLNTADTLALRKTKSVSANKSVN